MSLYHAMLSASASVWSNWGLCTPTNTTWPRCWRETEMAENDKLKGCDGCKKQTRWGEDFPSQWEKDEYVSRREMVKFLSLGSLLITGANFIAAAVPRFQQRGEFPRVRIASALDIAAGGSVLFRYPTDEDPCILVRDRAGKVLAYS